MVQRLVQPDLAAVHLVLIPNSSTLHRLVPDPEFHSPLLFEIQRIPPRSFFWFQNQRHQPPETMIRGSEASDLPTAEMHECTSKVGATSCHHSFFLSSSKRITLSPKPCTDLTHRHHIEQEMSFPNMKWNLISTGGTQSQRMIFEIFGKSGHSSSHAIGAVPFQHQKNWFNSNRTKKHSQVCIVGITSTRCTLSVSTQCTLSARTCASPFP